VRIFIKDADIADFADIADKAEVNLKADE